MEIGISTVQGHQYTTCDRIFGCYVSVFQRANRVFQYLNLDSIWDVFAAILTEPMTAFSSGNLLSRGNCLPSKFCPHNLNPSAVKTNAIAIFLIHGAGSNQGLWEPLANSLNNAGVGPLFTINMPKVGSFWRYERNVQKVEIDVVDARIEEIKKLGVKKIIIVGHSRGGQTGRVVSKNNSSIIKVISLGNPCRDAVQQEKFYDIVADFDAIFPWHSTLDPAARCLFATGHLGLLNSTRVHRRIIEVVNSCN